MQPYPPLDAECLIEFTPDDPIVSKPYPHNRRWGDGWFSATLTIPLPTITPFDRWSRAHGPGTRAFAARMYLLVRLAVYAAVIAGLTVGAIAFHWIVEVVR